MSGRLKKDCYLIVGAKKNRYGSGFSELPQPKIVSARTPPATKGNEIAIRLTVDLPKSLFADPTFTASISVDESAAGQTTIDAEVISNIEKVVADATGLTLTIESESGWIEKPTE